MRLETDTPEPDWSEVIAAGPDLSELTGAGFDLGGEPDWNNLLKEG